MPLSTTALLYLGADAIAPPDKKFGLGNEVPCRGVSVDLKTLSGVLPAAAIWSLREAGAVTVGIEAKKGLFGTKQRVAVRRAGGAPQGPVDAAILAVVDDNRPFAKDTIARWLGRDSSNPWVIAVTYFEQELIQNNLVREIQPQGVMGKIGKFASGRAKLEGNCAAIDQLRGEIDAATGRWQSLFQGPEAALAQALVKECRDGVDSRLEADDD